MNKLLSWTFVAFVAVAMFTASHVSAQELSPQEQATVAKGQGGGGFGAGLGGGLAAGLAVGFWESLDELRSHWAIDRAFEPAMSEAKREGYYADWLKAVSKSTGWV